MATNNQTYITTVQINDAQAKQKLQELEAEEKRLTKERDKAFSAGDKAYGEKMQKEINKTKKEIHKMRLETMDVSKILNNLSDASLAQLQKTAKSLNSQLRNIPPSAEKYKEIAEQLKEVNSEMAKRRSAVRGDESWTDKLANGFNKWQGAIVGAIGAITGITMTIRKSVQDYADMEEAMANVRKYTGWSDEEIRNFNEDLKKMDTRTSREELNAMAGDAGRLGITSQEAAMEFVDAADKISVALGDDLGDGAVATIGKLAQTFGDSDKMGLRGAMLATGSAVNELAASSSASAGYVVDFTSRLAGVSTQAGLAQTEIMGFASVLDQNMQQCETSATAVSQLISKMYQEPAKFAKLAGVDVQKFTKLLKEDANGALLQFLSTMQSKGGFDSLAPMFQEMGLSGTRCVGVLSTLATNLDEVKRQQDIAANAFKEGQSVLDEFNVQNETVQAGIDKAKKQFLEVSIALGEKLLPVVKYTISSGSLLVKGLYELVNIMPKLIPYIIAATAAVVMWNAAMVKALIIEKVSAAMKALRVAVIAVNAAVRANPWMALATVLTMVVAWLWNFFDVGNKIVPIFNKMSEGIKGAIKWVIDINHKFQEWYDSIGPIGKALVTLVNPIGVIASKVLDIANNWRKAKNAKEEYEKKKADEKKALEEQTNKDREHLRQVQAQRAKAKYDKNGMLIRDTPSSTTTTTTTTTTTDPNKEALARSKQILAEQNAANEIAYLKGEKLYQQYEDDKFAIQQAAYDRELAIYKKDSDDYKNTLNAKLLHEAKYAQELQKQDVEEIRMQRDIARQHIENTVTDAEEKKEALFQIDQQYMKEELNCYEKNTKEWLDLKTKMEQEQEEHKFELEKSWNEKAASFKKEWIKMSSEEQEQYYLDYAQQLYEKKLLTDEEYEQAKKEIRDAYKSEDGDESFGFGYMLDGIDQMMDAFKSLNKKIKEGKAEWTDYAKVGAASLQSVMAVMNTLANFTKASADAEIATTEAKYDKLIAAAEGNEQEQTRLEEEKAAKVKEIKLKQAESERGINIAQVLINAALGIAKGYADYGPIMGSVLAAVTTAMGIIQVATINKQYEAQVASINSGYYEGGYTGGNRYRREAGVVHEGEFVANHNAVNNPELAPVLDLINQAQMNNTVGSLTRQDLAAATGNQTVTPIVNVNTDNSDLKSSMGDMTSAVKELNRQLAEGVHTNLSMQEFKKAEKHYNQLLNNK